MAKKPENQKQDEIAQLFDAVKRGALAEVQELLGKGLSVDNRDDLERTPLTVAADAGHADVVQTLLDHGADVNARDVDGDTPLTSATHNNHLEAVKLLVSRGADLDLRNKDGSTALEAAQDFEFDDIATYLAAQSARSSTPEGEDNSTQPDDVATATSGTGETDDVEEDEISLDLELEAAEELYDEGNVEERDDSSASGASGVAASAPGPGLAPSFWDSHIETSKNLEEISPGFFGSQKEMSDDEIAQLVKDTDLKSEAMQKSTGKVLSIQFALQPDLPNRLKERKDLVAHAGTMRAWKRAGDACHKLEKTGIDTTPLGISSLYELSKAPTDDIMIDVATEAIAQKWRVRDIRKAISPLVKRAKMEASGEIAHVSPRCVEIIEGLDQPEKLMERVNLVSLLQDSNRLKTEFTFTELSRIHEKANAAETKVEKQKRALEEKGAGYVPVINFLRLIRKTISAVFEGDNS